MENNIIQQRNYVRLLYNNGINSGRLNKKTIQDYGKDLNEEQLDTLTSLVLSRGGADNLTVKQKDDLISLPEGTGISICPIFGPIYESVKKGIYGFDSMGEDIKRELLIRYYFQQSSRQGVFGFANTDLEKLLNREYTNDSVFS